MRRNVIALVLLTVISLVPSTAAFAQQKESENDQIVTVTGKAERRLDSISFRMTLKTEWFTARDGDTLTANYSYTGIRVEEPILPVTAKK